MFKKNDGIVSKKSLHTTTFISPVKLGQGLTHMGIWIVFSNELHHEKIRAVAGQRSSPDLSKSMIHDLDLKVAQVGRKSIKFQTNIYKHASTCSKDIDF